MATWTTNYINNLPDESFLYISAEESTGKDKSGKTVPRSARHFPYKGSDGKVDLPHLRNAIARIPQSNAKGLSAEKKTALQDKARKILDHEQGTGSSKEMGEFYDLMVITELRGVYPSVPIAADVDYEGLIAGDDKPQFLTIPIAKVNVTSANNRHYDEAFVVELMRQTLANKPIGLMGHLSESERATAFPPEAVHWVGALREGDTVWGKAYVVPGAVRDRIQRYKAQGKAIATSIDAFAKGEWDETLKATRMMADGMKLNQIDIAPADRAGIPSLAAVPMLTNEMVAPMEELEQENEMSQEEVINELREVTIPPSKGWKVPVQETQTDALASVREMLGVDDDTDIVTLIRELKEQTQVLTQAAIATRISELVNEGVKLPSARGIVTKLIVAADPRTLAEAETICAQVLEMAEVKELLAYAVQSAGGPAAIVSGKVQANNGRLKLEDTPENRQRAAARMGINI